MKIRITGLYEEIAQALNTLNAVPELDLLEISGPYPNRGASSLVRIYAEVRLTGQDGTATHDSGGFPGSREIQVTRSIHIRNVGKST